MTKVIAKEKLKRPAVAIKLRPFHRKVHQILLENKAYL